MSLHRDKGTEKDLEKNDKIKINIYKINLNGNNPPSCPLKNNQDHLKSNLKK